MWVRPATAMGSAFGAKPFRLSVFASSRLPTRTKIVEKNARAWLFGGLEPRSHPVQVLQEEPSLVHPTRRVDMGEDDPDSGKPGKGVELAAIFRPALAGARPDEKAR